MHVYMSMVVDYCDREQRTVRANSYTLLQKHNHVDLHVLRDPCMLLAGKLLFKCVQ